MTGEISYDLEMDPGLTFAEGAYRVGDGPWHVFVASKRDVPEPALAESTWDSGATGIVLRVPRTADLNKALVERLLGERLGVAAWVEVRGPDSMALR
jgi:hypothetical protein